jgi:hypothetical protein
MVQVILNMYYLLPYITQVGTSKIITPANIQKAMLQSNEYRQ